MKKRRASGRGGDNVLEAQRPEGHKQDLSRAFDGLRHPREQSGLAPEEEEEEAAPSIHSDEESDDSEGSSEEGEGGSSGDDASGDDEDEDSSEDDGTEEEEESEEDEDSLEEEGADGTEGKQARGRLLGNDAGPSVSGASSDEELDQAMLDLVAGKQPRRSRHVRGIEAAARGEDVGEPEAGDPSDSAEGDLEEAEDLQEAADASEDEDEDEDEEEDAKERERRRQARLWKALKSDPGSESSEDERPARNTIGNVPLRWYKDEDHIGYNVEGEKLMKKAGRRDQLERLLARNDNPQDWRTLYDEYNDEEITLSKEEVQLIQRIRQGRFPDLEVNPFEPEVDFFTREPMKHPLKNAPEPKRRFMPSKWEERKVVKLVRALRRGWLKLKKEGEEEEQEAPVYLLWADDGRVADKTAAGLTYIPPPKPPLPGHEESYHPPPEFLPTAEEKEEAAEKDPEEAASFVPVSYPCLRAVPQYSDFIKERFERCLDLYLCPRARRKRPFVKDARSLIPQLPKPSDLRPYPSTLLIRYLGHTATVRCVQPDPLGQWLASGSDDKTLRVWEVATGRCMRVWQLDERVSALAWCPNQALHLLAVCFGNTARLLCPGLASEEVEAATGQALEAAAKAASLAAQEQRLCRWSRLPKQAGLDLVHNHPVTWFAWHGRGDYFATVAPTGNTQAVLVHQLSRGSSQNPFRRNRGRVVRVAFHPSKPVFFVATENAVRVYDLALQQLVKKLLASSGSITSFAIHSSGDHVITGSEDKRLAWYDMDLSTKPYKVLRYHAHSVSGVAFHRSFPLFASSSDDATVHVFHGMVYQDLMTNPLLVPLKVLRGHGAASVRALAFHPSQPWLFSAGEDAAICLFTD